MKQVHDFFSFDIGLLKPLDSTNTCSYFKNKIYDSKHMCKKLVATRHYSNVNKRWSIFVFIFDRLPEEFMIIPKKGEKKLSTRKWINLFWYWEKKENRLIRRWVNPVMFESRCEFLQHFRLIFNILNILQSFNILLKTVL